jgi:hypothetical protein
MTRHVAFTESAWEDQDNLADYPLDELEDELPPARPMAFTPTARPWCNMR